MKTKLTAALVSETTKQTLVDLRGEFDVTEKQLMDLIVKQALRRKSELTALVETFHSNLETAKADNKATKMAEYKEKAALKRREKSAEKLRAKLAKIEDVAPEAEVEVEVAVEA